MLTNARCRQALLQKNRSPVIHSLHDSSENPNEPSVSNRQHIHLGHRCDLRLKSETFHVGTTIPDKFSNPLLDQCFGCSGFLKTDSIGNGIAPPVALCN